MSPSRPPPHPCSAARRAAGAPLATVLAPSGGTRVDVRFEAPAAVLDRPALQDLVRRDDCALVIEELDRPVDASRVGALLDHLVTPLPELEVLVHPALH